MPDLEPYREQRPFLDGEHRFYAFVSGLGAGKTAAGILRAVKNAKVWNPGATGLIVAPTGSSIRNVILPAMREFGLLDAWEYRGKAAEQPGIHLPNGTRIILEGADNRRKIDRMRGYNLAWWWIDEAAIIDSEIWDVLPGRLREGQYRNGFVTTTPQGRNWLFDVFVDRAGAEYSYGEARLYEADDRLSILGVPSHANPHSPDDYKESLESEYEGQFYRQEVQGEFVSFEGLIYPWFGEDSHVVDAHPSNIGRVIYGVDWGFSNPSVLLAIAETRTGEYVVLDEFYENRVTVNDLARVITEMQSHYQPGPVYCDPADPASIEELKREGIDAVEADNEVRSGIQKVTSLAPDLGVHQSCQNLINEFGMYRYQDGGDSDDPVKKNDHAMDALRYALHTHEQRGGYSIGVAFG